MDFSESESELLSEALRLFDTGRDREARIRELDACCFVSAPQEDGDDAG
jgi:hypothetical protein